MKLEILQNTKLWTIIFLSSLGATILLSIVGNIIESSGLIKNMETINKIGILCIVTIILISFMFMTISIVPIFVNGFIAIQIKIGNQNIEAVKWVIQHQIKIMLFIYGIWLTGLIMIISAFISGRIELPLERDEIPIKLDKTFQLKIGQTAFIKEEGLRIKLLDVAEDFRCPKEVLCSKHSEPMVNIEISADKDFLNLQQEQIIKTQLNKNKNTITFQNYFIKLVQVNPYPKQNQTIKKENYIVSFVVFKNQKIEAYVYEDKNNIDNLNKIHVGDIFLNDKGELSLLIFTEGKDAENLKKQFDEIKQKKTLLLKYEEFERINGVKVLAMKGKDINSDDPRYIWAVEHQIKGFDTEVVEVLTSDSLFKQNYAVFPASYDISFLSGNNKRYTLSDEDIQKSIKLLEQFLNNKKEIQALSNYKIQFFGYLNEKNEKIIWANFFCSDYKNWKKDLIFVMDGGNCFFNIKINLNTQEVFDFHINGEA